MSLAAARRFSCGVMAGLLGVALAVVALGDRGTGDGWLARAASVPEAAAAADPSADEDASEVLSESERSTSETSAHGSSGEGVPPHRTGRGVSKAPLITSSPRTASRRGAVVAGFPLAVLPVLPGSSVRSSGVSSRSGAVQISLVATDDGPPGRVLTAYRRILSAYGFVETPAPAVGGSTASGFARGRDRLTVTTTGADRRTTYSLFGVLRAGSSR